MSYSSLQMLDWEGARMKFRKETRIKVSCCPVRGKVAGTKGVTGREVMGSKPGWVVEAYHLPSRAEGPPSQESVLGRS